jgi:enamine deaminase RidA (YjgF/YER057c/UK114 family)
MIEYLVSSPEASYSLAGIVSGPGRLVYVAGQVGVGEDGKVVPGGIMAETDATFDHIEGILAKAGGRLADVVRVRVFLTSLDDYGSFGEVRKRRFPEGLPASTAVQVAGLLMGACVEIDAVAFIPDSR